MNKEEIDNLEDYLRNELPKIELPIPITTFGSIDLDDLMDSIRQFKKVPTFDELFKENKMLREQLEEKEEQLNIMSEAFDELKIQKQDYTQINILEMKLAEKNKVIDEILNHDCFSGYCPLSEINDDNVEDICDCDNCIDDYKKCWLKYFKNKILERGKNVNSK